VNFVRFVAGQGSREEGTEGHPPPRVFFAKEFGIV